MLVQHWANVFDVGPVLNQRWAIIPRHLDRGQKAQMAE